MSMWEFEALAEMSVRMVDASTLAPDEKRNAYANIYALVSEFDVSFVHFRTVDALTKASFFHRIEIAQHPDYVDHRDYFDAVVAEGRSKWISVHKPDSDEYLPADSLFEPNPHETSIKPGLWFDSTMPLWSRAVEAGLLTGLAAEPVKIWTAKQTIIHLIDLAAQQGPPRHGLLKMLHGMIVYTLVYSEDPPKPGDSDLAAIRDLPELKVALAAQQEDWIDERFDARTQLEHASPQAKPFLEWWCAAYPD